jgi:tetratricopeptide (TPR) repeat protein
MEGEKYDDAIKAFDKANSFIPYRENYNNIGVARVRKALVLRLPDDIEKQFPLRFTYPIEIDIKSRLLNERKRTLDDSDEEIKSLLKSAQSDFEKAISLDKDYTKGVINLACVLDLLGNYPKSIGTIFDLTKEQQNSIEAKRILAIAYFHDKQENKAYAIWNELKM